MGLINDYGSMQTPAPSLEDLHRRQDEEMTVTRAPDGICGFISERPGASLGCPNDDYCYFFPAAAQQTPSHNRVICCGETSCQWYSTCYNSAEYFTSKKCTDGCEVDNYILKCTAEDGPYCNTISWEGNTIDYSCNDADITTMMSAALTYKGEEGREFFTMSGDQVSVLFRDQDGTESTAESGDSTATKGSAPAATESKDSGGSGTNTGAIVGGVVGGVGAIALLAVAILLFLRMRRKKKVQDVSPPEYEATPRDDNSNKEALQPGQQAGTPYSDTPPNAALAVHEVEVKDKPQELADNAPKKEPVELA